MTIKEMRELVEKLKTEKDYPALGNLFFSWFAFLPKGMKRNFASDMFDTFSDKEQKLMEET
jgi:hypothetical protein